MGVLASSLALSRSVPTCSSSLLISPLSAFVYADGRVSIGHRLTIFRSAVAVEGLKIVGVVDLVTSDRQLCNLDTFGDLF